MIAFKEATRWLCLVGVLLFVIGVVLPTTATADFSGNTLYAGTLTGAGIVAAGGAGPDSKHWADDVTITWDVQPGETDWAGVGAMPWTYSYTFATSGHDLSHFIIEVSAGDSDDPDGLPAFSLARLMDFINTQSYVLDGDEPEVVLETYTSTSHGDSNPGMPDDVELYGVKFDSALFEEDAGEWTVTFDSYRNPMWGDFYAMGGQSYAYNADFGDPDGIYKIAVPDTSYVPVPGAALLGFLGLGAAGLKLRKRV